MNQVTTLFLFHFKFNILSPIILFGTLNFWILVKIKYFHIKLKNKDFALLFSSLTFSKLHYFCTNILRMTLNSSDYFY